MTDKTGGAASPHPHAKLMALYAEDAMETSEPWERWEFRADGGWRQLKRHPEWCMATDTAVDYRRKPRMRSLNGFEYPEPESKAPAFGEEYWAPHLGLTCLSYSFCWDGDEFDHLKLRRGLLHLSREAAEAHARAIIKAGGGEV